MKDLHSEIEPQLLANGTRMLKGPHVTTFFEEWLTKIRSHHRVTVDTESRGEEDCVLQREEEMQESVT